jgi:hypothetical protein
MNTLLKSTAIAAVIIGSSAVSLRHQETGDNRDIMSKSINTVDFTNFQDAFIEKTAAKYDCAGTAVSKVKEMRGVISGKKSTLKKSCEKKLDQLKAEKDRDMLIFNKNSTVAAEGKLPLNLQCTNECTTPNSIFSDEEKRIKNEAVEFKKASEEIIKKSAAKVKAASTTDLENKAKKTAANLDKVTKEVNKEKTRLDTDFANKENELNKQLHEDKNRAAKNKEKEVSEADKVMRSEIDDCNKSYKARIALIAKDQKTLGDIKAQLATLKLCPSKGTSASFLEVDTAARLEKHCALVRETIKDKAKSAFLEVGGNDLVGTDGNVANWDTRVTTENNAAREQEKKCRSAATKGYRKASSKAEAAMNKMVAKFVDVHKQAIALNKKKIEGLKAAQDKLVDVATKENQEVDAALSIAQKNLAMENKRHAKVLQTEAAAQQAKTDQNAKNIIAAQSKLQTYIEGQTDALNAFKVEVENSAIAKRSSTNAVCASDHAELEEEARIVEVIINVVKGSALANMVQAPVATKSFEDRVAAAESLAAATTAAGHGSCDCVLLEKDPITKKQPETIVGGAYCQKGRTCYIRSQCNLPDEKSCTWTSESQKSYIGGETPSASESSESQRTPSTKSVRSTPAPTGTRSTSFLSLFSSVRKSIGEKINQLLH